MKTKEKDLSKSKPLQIPLLKTRVNTMIDK